MPLIATKTSDESTLFPGSEHTIDRPSHKSFNVVIGSYNEHRQMSKTNNSLATDYAIGPMGIL